MSPKSLKSICALSLTLVGAACAGGGDKTVDASKAAPAAAAGPTNDPAVRAAIDSADAKFVTAFKARQP